jgi:hypothetical protein
MNRPARTNWMLTFEIPGAQHRHLDVIDPLWAAIVLGVIEDLRGAPLKARITDWTVEWHCPTCGAWRFDLDPLPSEDAHGPQTDREAVRRP